MKNTLEVLRDKCERTLTTGESQVHKDMKWWIAKKYFNEGIPVRLIEFEYKLDGWGYNEFTRPDVFIKHFGNVAIYCQTDNGYNWLRKFLDNNLPILRKFTEKQIVVFPKNVSKFHPVRDDREYNKSLRDEGVEILFSPVMLDIQREVNVRLDYEAMKVLKKLNKKFADGKSLSDFILQDLENLTLR